MLSIVIGTYNRLPQLRMCIESLVDKVDTPHEIIVVDAGSTDGTVEHLASLKEPVRLISHGIRMGQAKSLNQVLRVLNSELICWLSDDNIARPGMIDQAVSILEHNNDIGMVGLKLKDISGPYVDLPYQGGIWPPGILNVNQGMVRSCLLHRVGYFDESFRDYGIDGDLTTKILLLGCKVVYTKRIALYHDRKHGIAPWIAGEGRKARMVKARSLYNKKYRGLIKGYIDSKAHSQLKCFKKFFDGSIPGDMDVVSKLGLGSFLLCKMIYLVTGNLQGLTRMAMKLGLEIGGNYIEYSQRDWRNVFHTAFISEWDLLKNHHKPYYLVQQIPKELRTLNS